MREVLPKMNNAGGSEPCGKSTCQKYDHFITTNFFTTKACGEAFKIQTLKVLYLLRSKIWKNLCWKS